MSRASRLWFAACIAALVSCGDGSDPGGPGPDTPGPGTPSVTGAARLTFATTGDDLDSDGYTITLAGVTASAPAAGDVLLSNLPAGDHLLTVFELAANCRVEGANPRTLRVVAAQTLAERIDVRCDWLGPERIIASVGGTIISMSTAASGVRVLQSTPGNYFAALSPDGKRIAFTSERDGNQEIYVMNADGSDVVNLTRSPTTRDWWPKWSPDSKRIVFFSWNTAVGPQSGEIYVVNADGSGNWLRLTDNNALDADPEWSPDGSRIVFMSERDAGNQEIYVMNADGSQPVRLTNSAGLDGTPAWSPDGSRIAFASTRFEIATDGYDIMVMDANGSNVQRLTTDREIDVRPIWSPDGQRLLFSHRVGVGNYDIWRMNADGTALTMLLGGPGNQQAEAWGNI